MGLHKSAASWTTAHRGCHPQARDPHRHRQSDLGAPACARRTCQARPPDHCLRCVADPARRRARPRTPLHRPDLETVPDRASPRHPRGRLVHIDTVLLRPTYAYALIVIEHGTRRVHLADITANPDAAWTMQAAATS